MAHSYCCKLQCPNLACGYSMIEFLSESKFLEYDRKRKDYPCPICKDTMYIEKADIES